MIISTKFRLYRFLNRFLFSEEKNTLKLRAVGVGEDTYVSKKDSEFWLIFFCPSVQIFLKAFSK